VPLVIDEAELRQLPVSADPDVENLEAGLSLDEFLDNFPTVRREQAVQVLQHWRPNLRRLAETG